MVECLSRMLEVVVLSPAPHKLDRGACLKPNLAEVEAEGQKSRSSLATPQFKASLDPRFRDGVVRMSHHT